jgi:hypothetical protein
VEIKTISILPNLAPHVRNSTFLGVGWPTNLLSHHARKKTPF